MVITTAAVSAAKDRININPLSCLQEKGFTISTTNEKLGLITTNSKYLTNEADAAISKVLLGYAENRWMKISINVNDKLNFITIAPVSSTSTSPWSSTANQSETLMNENEIKFVNKIASEIMISLSLNPKNIEIIEQN